MPRGRGIYDDDDADESKGGRKGPSDQGRDDETTPDVAETDHEPTA
jgi:hypothetical protein